MDNKRRARDVHYRLQVLAGCLFWLPVRSGLGLVSRPRSWELLVVFEVLIQWLRAQELELVVVLWAVLVVLLWAGYSAMAAECRRRIDRA